MTSLRLSKLNLEQVVAQPPSTSVVETVDDAPVSATSFREATFLYVVLDCEQPALGGSRFSLAELDEVLVGRGAERCISRQTVESSRRLMISIPTSTLSSKHARLLRVGERWAIQDRGSRNGTWLNACRIDFAELKDGDLFQVGRTFFLFRVHKLPSSRTTWGDITDQGVVPSHSGLNSLSPETTLDNEALQAIAASKISVLLLGCTGTGKEVTARAVHALSSRPGQFCAVNCGALPSGLVESTLFGHVKGAFSGAVSNQPGVVRSADNGTLFLDEVGDLPLTAQTTLLRVLQEGELMPVGASTAVPVDLRVVAATHQPLEELIRRKRFREDLYARLAGYVHRLRPLEARREDFGQLFAHLLRRAAAAGAHGITLTTEAGWALLRHAWPTNIRELEHAIARAVVLAGGDPIGVRHFPCLLDVPPNQVSRVQVRSESVDIALRDQLDGLMRQYHGNVAAVARELGKGATQIQRWLKRVGLVADRYRG